MFFYVFKIERKENCLVDFQGKAQGFSLKTYPFLASLISLQMSLIWNEHKQ